MGLDRHGFSTLPRHWLQSSQRNPGLTQGPIRRILLTGDFMLHVRIVSLTLLALTARIPALGQSVVSTHSGIVYFFGGDVFLGDERLEQKFGRFPDIGEGRELRTERGRAEVLLTPGVFLRIGENSTIRLLSNKLSDTRVELLRGSTILESNEAGKDTSVTLIHKNWRIRVPQQGVYRVDAAPPRIQVYKGEVEVSTDGQNGTVMVKESENLPLAGVLVTERATKSDADDFKSWAMNRSQAIASDNAVAAGIVDDPSQFDNAPFALAGISYFPAGVVSPLGINSPYGLSFWTPYQSMLASIYFSPHLSYMYGPVQGWPTGIRSYSNPGYPNPGYSNPAYRRLVYPNPTIPWRTGGAVSRSISPPHSYSPPARYLPHAPAPAPPSPPPHVVVHPGAGAHVGAHR